MKVRQLHPFFAAEANDIDLGSALDHSAVAEIRAAMAQYGVLVFRDQPTGEPEILQAFAARLGPLDDFTTYAYKGANRGDAHIGRVTNLDAEGNIVSPSDRTLIQGIANRLWHVDSSFRPLPATYSLLAARIIPPEGGNTEFCDTRAAYDALSDPVKAKLQGLIGRHSLLHSRELIGFTEWSEEERKRLAGAEHPLVRTHPESGRKALYIAAHLGEIVGWPKDEARAFIDELMQFATQPRFVHAHVWRERDLVIYDNRSVMHRATPFDTQGQRRELLTTRLSGEAVDHKENMTSNAG